MSWTRKQSLPPVSPHTVDYFYGRISRDEAEKWLRDGHDGLFLLRWCISNANGYAISVCFQRTVHHYAVDVHSDGRVSIAGGKKFAGPIELVNHHRKKRAGMVTKLKTPCNRPPELPGPYFWFGVTINDFTDACDRQTRRLSRQDPQLVASQLHLEQSWFHGVISRDDAERELRASGPVDGKFLVRERGDNTYALSVCHRGVVWHYEIDVESTGTGERLNIQNGPTFDNLMDLITFYHCGGLYSPLLYPCQRPEHRSRSRNNELDVSRSYTRSRSAESLGRFRPDVVSASSSYIAPSHPRLKPMRSRSQESLDYSNVSRPSRPPYLQVETSTIAESDADSLYFVVRKQSGSNIVDICRDQLHITGKLGTGQFGSVAKAAYCIDQLRFTVAVKTLKTDVTKDTSRKRELMKEAAIMAELDSPHIIRMIGLCKSDSMLILEFAPLGPLKDFLLKHKETSMSDIIELMQQVARGMAYLESKNVVHRDLAARNILLVDAHRAKISDFGLSRDLTYGGKDYYEPVRKKDEKWPIKWCAPECLRTRKFDSKSDVWSYGVALWEATSYAETPYKDIDLNDYQRAIERGRRLGKPRGCPSNVYGLMLHCWALERDGRPTFEQIVKRFNRMTRIEIEASVYGEAAAVADNSDDDYPIFSTEQKDTFVKRVA